MPSLSQVNLHTFVNDNTSDKATVHSENDSNKKIFFIMLFQNRQHLR